MFKLIKKISNVSYLNSIIFITIFIICFLKNDIFLNSFEYIKAHHYHPHCYYQDFISIFDFKLIFVYQIYDIIIFSALGYFLKIVKDYYIKAEIIINVISIIIPLYWWFIILYGNYGILADNKQYFFIEGILLNFIGTSLLWLLILIPKSIRKLFLQKYITFFPIISLLYIIITFNSVATEATNHMIHVVFNSVFFISSDLLVALLIILLIYMLLAWNKILCKTVIFIAVYIIFFFYLFEKEYFLQFGNFLHPNDVSADTSWDVFFDSVKQYFTPFNLILIGGFFLSIVILTGSKYTYYKNLTHKEIIILFSLFFVIGNKVFLINEVEKNESFFQNPLIYYIENINNKPQSRNVSIKQLVEYYHEQKSGCSKHSTNQPFLTYPDKAPNVILIVMESVAYRYFGVCNPNENTTPNLNKRKSDMIVFNRYHSTCPVTEKALFSINLSLYDSYYAGVLANYIYYPNKSYIGLGEVFHNSKYNCAFFHSGSLNYNNQKGFFSRTKVYQLFDIDNIPWDKEKHKVNWGIMEEPTIEAIKTWIKSNKNKPFFIEYETITPHHPYSTIDGFTPFGTSDDLSRYKNGIYYLDYNFENLIKFLEEENLADNTIIVFTGDHGEAFGEHPNNYIHTNNIYQENLHVPLIIYNKRLTSSTIENNSLSNHIDLGPTILDMCSMKIPSTWMGCSLLRRNENDDHIIYFSSLSERFGIRKNDLKIMFKSDFSKPEVYDILNDPEESNNLITSTFYENHNELYKQLEDWKEKQEQLLYYFDKVIKQ